jgi:hypothetical protein
MGYLGGVLDETKHGDIPYGEYMLRMGNYYCDRTNPTSITICIVTL